MVGDNLLANCQAQSGIAGRCSNFATLHIFPKYSLQLVLGYANLFIHDCNLKIGVFLLPLNLLVG